MYVEEKLVILADRYQKIPDRNHPDHMIIAIQQLKNAERYHQYLVLRKKICLELVERAQGLKEQLSEIKTSR